VPETQPAREVLADSRTLKGGGAAGIATVGAADIEVAQEVLAETQSASCPWCLHRLPAPGAHRRRNPRADRLLEEGPAVNGWPSCSADKAKSRRLIIGVTSEV
jgi:hypothetical protein